MRKIKYQPIFLIITAIIWGTAFVSQRSAMSNDIGPFTFNAIRFLLGGVVLLPIALIFHFKFAIRSICVEEKKLLDKNTIIGGIICGVLLCVATNFQQMGLIEVPAGKAGFITALYIIEVPIVGIFLKKKTSFLIWIAVPLSLIGMFLLCMVGENFSFGLYELYVFIASIIFTAHVLVIDYYSPKSDGVMLSCIQFFIASIVSCLFMLIFEKPNIQGIKDSTFEILYSGILSCAVAYTLQVLGQKNMNPATCSIILSFESTISVIAGWIVLNEKLSLAQIFGCVIMVIAIIIAQIQYKEKIKLNNGSSDNT